MRVTLVCLVVWLGCSAPALACSYPDLPPFELRAAEDDTEAPAPPDVRVERVKRGKGPDRDGCSWEGTSCDDIGYVLLEVRTNGEELGFVLETQGESPSLARHLNRPVAATPTEPGLGQLRLTWSDGEGNRSYDFDIHVWSVDRAGNMSELPTKVHVESSGSDGCTALSSQLHGSWLLALLLLLFARRAWQRS